MTLPQLQVRYCSERGKRRKGNVLDLCGLHLILILIFTSSDPIHLMCRNFYTTSSWSSTRHCWLVS